MLYSKLTQHTVALGDASAAVQFVFNDPKVSIPEPTEADVMHLAGFDEGPPGKGDGKKK